MYKGGDRIYEEREKRRKKKKKREEMEKECVH